MRLGESDTIRMRLVPDGSGYRLESEFSEHDITGQQVIKREKDAGGQENCAGIDQEAEWSHAGSSGFNR